MISTAIELHFDCRNCENPVHVNAMTDQVPCASCDRVTEFSWKQWQSVLEDSFDEIPDYAMGRGGRSQTFAGAGPNTDILYSRFDPYCYSCKTDFDAPALVRAGVDSVTCAECGDTWHARPPGEELRKHFPRVKYLFAEDPKLIPDAFGNRPKAEHPTGGKPVVFGCPACGGGLKVDGSDRMVPCDHCESSVYLPDDLWRRLHPVQTKRRWFLWWDEGGHVRDPSRFPVEDSAEDLEIFEDDDEEVSLSEIMKAKRSNGRPRPVEVAVPALAPPPTPVTPRLDEPRLPSPEGTGPRAAATSSASHVLALAFIAFLLMLGVAAGVYFFVSAVPEEPPVPTSPGH